MTTPFDGDLSSEASAQEDHLHEECGVFGIFGHPDASAHTALGLHALQHRGQEAAGIVSSDGSYFYTHRALGLVGDNFNSADVMSKLKGHIAIGHNRYATTGGTLLRNVQPFYADLSLGGFALAHNGKLWTTDNIGSALAGREIGRHLRELGVATGGPPSFAKSDRSRFLVALDTVVSAALRASSAKR